MNSPPKTETSGSGGGKVGAELGVTTASDAGGVSAEAAVVHEEEVAVSGEGGLQIEVEALLRCRTGAGLFAYEEGERSESQRRT